MEKHNVYFISGLGADYRLFSKIKLSENFNIIHVKWVYTSPRETLSQYAVRLQEQIDTSRPFSIIGLSMGGMVASEMMAQIKPKHTILISSAATSNEIPWYYKIMGMMKLPHIVPATLLKLENPFLFWFFGASSGEEKKLLKQVIKDTDPVFLKWSLIAITSWRKIERPHKIYHIHGSADKVLPLKFIKADRKIQGGEHLMVISHAGVISELLQERLDS